MDSSTNNLIIKFKEINVKKIDFGSFVDKDRMFKTKEKLEIIHTFISEMIEVIQLDLKIPIILNSNVQGYIVEFADFVKQFSTEIKGEPIDITNAKDRIFRDFDTWYDNYINKHDNYRSTITFYETYNTLKNLDKRTYQENFKLIDDLKIKMKSESEAISTILEELQRTASKVTMSDYAKIFGDESKNHNRSSYIWLGIGVLLAALFFILLLWTDVLKKFPTEDLTDKGEFLKYNISNLLIKLLIYAVLIFLISFSFRQYSIGRHLQTINKHRQNGLDSFKLFVESISKDDTEARNNLMLQLAKAIYEQTQTGYINDKNQNLNSSIVEITKMIGANKPN
jgi:hypothetical protein